ncbi:MAG: alkaline phosphatase family protein [Pirellulaceae bacterium]
MPAPLVVLSLPGLRLQDIPAMPVLAQLASAGQSARIEHSFPSVTWPSQCNALTGSRAEAHGVVANGFYWRDKNEVEMWTAWNEVIERPQIWDSIKQKKPELKTAAWFPMLAKGCNADYVCMPAPIHKPDGSEDMWCHTKPQEFYGELLDQLGHFPLQHFWGPLAGIQSSQWIVESAVLTARKFAPDFWYIYLPHLDYAAQKFGPNSEQAMAALGALDSVLATLTGEFANIYPESPVWLAISEYVITDVDHVCYPNRRLRESGLLKVVESGGREQLDFGNSAAWAMVDHQFSHVFVKNNDANIIARVVELFDGVDGLQSVVAGDQRQYLNLDHPRSGDVVLVSTPNSWQAYYWWLDDDRAPAYARTVDIHRKPGYDPVELFFDPATKSIPLDAAMVKGSHGAPAITPEMQGALICSCPDITIDDVVADIKLHDLMLDLVR